MTYVEMLVELLADLFKFNAPEQIRVPVDDKTGRHHFVQRSDD